MKNFPLWADTVFAFLSLLLFGFCLLRFSLPAGGAFAIALVAAAGGATLLHLFLRRRSRKRGRNERERDEIRQLSLHLALDTPAHNADLLVESLNALHGEENKGTYTKICDNTLRRGEETAFLNFRFEPLTADELCPILRETGHKTVYASDFTQEARSLAEAFGVTLRDAEQVYELVHESGHMPQTLLAPPRHKLTFREKLSARLHKKYWRGYALSGSMLLLFSLVTVFPLYYVIAGGLLLAFAAFVRFFGKEEK